MKIWRPRAVLFLFLALVAGSRLVTAEADVRLISQGREVTLEEHLVPGKLVIFDFYADWCAPCRVLTPRLERLVAEQPDRIALRKVDIIDWESPVSRQHQIGSLPHLVLYGADGTRLAVGASDRVLRVLARELGQGGVGGGTTRRGRQIPVPVWITLVAAIVVGSLLLRSRNRTGHESEPGVEPRRTQPEEDGSPMVWFVMVNESLEGPYSVNQLEALHRSGDLSSDLRVRRRGDATWGSVGDVLTRG